MRYPFGLHAKHITTRVDNSHAKPFYHINIYIRYHIFLIALSLFGSQSSSINDLHITTNNLSVRISPNTLIGNLSTIRRIIDSLLSNQIHKLTICSHQVSFKYVLCNIIRASYLIYKCLHFNVLINKKLVRF